MKKSKVFSSKIMNLTTVEKLDMAYSIFVLVSIGCVFDWYFFTKSNGRNQLKQLEENGRLLAEINKSLKENKNTCRVNSSKPNNNEITTRGLKLN